VSFYNEVAQLGKNAGVVVAIHPNSAPTSLVRSPEEYAAILAQTEDSGLMFNPDAGHMTRCGHDILDTFRRHISRVVHVHTKDVDSQGKWMPMGKGVSPYPEMVELLKGSLYAGWIVVEEESDAVWEDVAKAVTENYRYLHSII
jgi:inosose dehydratase